MATKIIDGSAPGAVDLANMVRERVTTAGTISSADIAAAGATASAEPHGAGLRESTTLENPSSKDPLVQGAVAQESVSNTLVEAARAAGGDYELDTETVTLSAEDKQAFISALVANKRLELDFSRFGGGVTCRVRSRTVAETKALIAYQRDVLNKNQNMTQLEYSTLLRLCLVAAQLVSINFDTFPELEKPLMREISAGATSEPGWLPRIEYWMGVDEARFNAAWSCVHEFELKYWNLVSNANDQDFWATAASS